MKDYVGLPERFKIASKFGRSFFVPHDTPSVQAMRVNQHLRPLIEAVAKCIQGSLNGDYYDGIGEPVNLLEEGIVELERAIVALENDGY